jgi:hypothetical protein
MTSANRRGDSAPPTFQPLTSAALVSATPMTVTVPPDDCATQRNATDGVPYRSRLLAAEAIGDGGGDGVADLAAEVLGGVTATRPGARLGPLAEQ